VSNPMTQEKIDPYVGTDPTRAGKRGADCGRDLGSRCVSTPPRGECRAEAGTANAVPGAGRTTLREPDGVRIRTRRAIGAASVAALLRGDVGTGRPLPGDSGGSRCRSRVICGEPSRAGDPSPARART
jgi:hypothetical protein